MANIAILETLAKEKGYSGVEDYIDALIRHTGAGSQIASTQDIFYGVNRRQQGIALPKNLDGQGFTFFTKPMLNLHPDNMAGVRLMAPLLAAPSNSYQRAVRAYLDPISARLMPDTCSSSLVDNRSPFISLFSNALVSLSGWPDQTGHVYVSPEGVFKESWTQFDGIFSHLGEFSLQCVFQNIEGDPVSLLLATLAQYMQSTYCGLGGQMMRRPEAILRKKLEYQTRIYRFIVDKTGRSIQKWAACGCATLTGISSGSSFNYSRDSVFSSENDQVTAPFSCTAAMYNDPIVLDEFNKLGEMFFPLLATAGTDKRLVKIPHDELNHWNYWGYPRVNVLTNELSWYLPAADYEKYNPSK